MRTLHRLQLPQIIHFHRIAIVKRTRDELGRIGLVAFAQDAMHRLGREAHAPRRFRVDADAHVGQVVDGVDILVDVGPDLVAQLVVAVADLEGNVGVDVRSDAGLEQFFAGLVDGGEGAVARVGNGVAVAQRRTGEFGGERGAILHHCCNRFLTVCNQSMWKRKMLGFDVGYVRGVVDSSLTMYCWEHSLYYTVYRVRRSIQSVS